MRWINIRSFPKRFSLSTPLCPWCATSAIQILLIRNPFILDRAWISSQRGSYSSYSRLRCQTGWLWLWLRSTVAIDRQTLGKPLACAAMMVTSPRCGLGLSRGIYCFTAKWRVSSCSFAVAPGYSLICWHGTTCSTMRKGPEDEDMVVVLVVGRNTAQRLPL